MADIRIRIAVIALCVIGLLGGGIGLLTAKHSAPTPITITTPDATQAASSDPLPIIEPNNPNAAPRQIKAPAHTTPAPVPPGGMYVDVSGAVRYPSLYQVPPGSRVMHAVHAAGGAISKADLDAVNLAEPVKDGEKIYIPFKSERIRAIEMSNPTPKPIVASMPRTRHVRPTDSIVPLPIPTPIPMPVHIRPITYAPVAAGNTINNGTQKLSLETTPAPNSPHVSDSSVEKSLIPDTKLKSPEEGKVNINIASPEELERLPGIGPAMAARIIEYRSQVGSFENIDALKQVKGLGDKKVAKLAPFLTF